MSLKIVIALVSAASLCCAQSASTSSSGVPAKEAAPAVLPAVDQPAPAPHAAPVGDQPAPSGKAATEGTIAGTKPDSGHKLYVIGPLDVLQVKVWNNPNLSGIVAVDSDGMLTMPLIGEIKADGLTARQLRDEVTRRLKECCVNNPEGEVDVQVVKNNSKRYFVYGGVLHGGEFPLDRDTTVMDALSLTGGFKEFANPKKIYILHGIRRSNFNYKDVSQGKHMEENIPLENGDRIFVPE